MSTILITGATGKLGRLVVEKLMDRVPAAEIVAGGRKIDRLQDLVERGVQVRQIDYDEPGTIDAALRGVRKVLLISGKDPNRVEQHRAVIDAARRAGVERLVYTSGLRAATSPMLVMRDHRATEELVKASGIPFTILRNSWYVENYTEAAEPALRHGAMLGAAGDGLVSVAPRADYAEAAAVVLTTPGHEGKTYELGGDTPHTLAEIASELARVGGKPVVYQDLPEPELAQALARAGVPEGFAKMLADADTGIKRGDLLDDTHALSQLIGHPTTPLDVAVERALTV